MQKIIQPKHIENVVSQIKKHSRSIVLVGGCFDILHAGHIQFLKHAKKHGDTLIVILESDEAIHVLKGDGRPVHSQETRAKILSQLSTVNYVIVIPPLSADSEYFELVKKIKPDIIAVTSDDPIKKIKEEQAKIVGGKVKDVMTRMKPYSSTYFAKHIS